MNLKLGQFVSNSLYTFSRQVLSVVLTLAVSSLLALLLGALVLASAAGALFPGVPADLLWPMLLAVPPLLLLDVLQGVFIGLQDFKRYNLLALLPDGLLLALLLGLALAGGGVSGALAAYLLSRLLIVPVTGWLLLRGRLARPVRRPEPAYVRDALSYGGRSHLANLVSFLHYRQDQFLVNSLLGPAALGVYAIGVTLSEGLSLLAGGVTTVLLPRIAELKDDPATRREMTPLVARHMVVIAGAVCVGLFAFSHFIVAALYPGEFAPAGRVLQLLLPAVFSNSVAKVVATDIAARGRPELNLYSGLVAVVANALLNLALIPLWGIQGAAVASSVSYSLGGLIMLVLYGRLSGVTLDKVLLIQPSDWALYRRLIPRLRALP
jgi:O-antigen/teichoic acid export membrane protein